ncbi:MAG: PKD domain-containing protein, partial [Balneolaceae bacterium]|nr:PKD domain-containing protein [Balneolaceae bacterium]
RRQYNALRSSGNANDLRGKILRIKVNEDGSYDIPDGNLYPEGRVGTRPEIYVQGNRNPYRISIDRKTGYLYWGEVGPDANSDSMATRGPRGYDEVNQAREAGNFGWPMFVGDNYPYRRFDYATGEPGEAFNPETPVNDSRLNTGIRELPPAKPAFIWYPYAQSPEFPEVGSGGRNAMAGPVYYTDMYPESTRLPDYFDEKLIIYDWVRGWIKLVTMWPNGDYSKMESFMPETDFNALIDMEVGPEGRLYLLEYGSGWFTQNDDSGLSIIEFNPGNRKPVVQELLVDRTSGTLPLTVQASVEATDPEDDDLSYRWTFGDGTSEETTNPQVEHTFREVGDYDITVEVTDGELSTASTPVSVYAGNAAPEVSINIEGNSSFYFPGVPVKYEVEISDKDSDVSDMTSLVVSADYVEGSDMAEASQGHQVMTEATRGKNLIETLDCQACHKLDSESIGPSYMAIAKQYQDSSDAALYLMNKIIQGGAGVWGETAMPAHLDISDADARRIVTWIQSLAGGGRVQESMPAEGVIEDPTLGKQVTQSGVLILSASYTDQGGPNIKPLTGNTTHYLRNSTMSFTNAQNLEGYTTMTYQGNFLLMVPQEPGSFSLNRIDMNGIGSARLMTAFMQPLESGYNFELRLDSPDGKLVGEGAFEPNSNPSGEAPFFQPVTIDIDPVTDGQLHDLYIVSEPAGAEKSGTLVLNSITFMLAN